MSLKTLADKVIARNDPRNQRATDTGKVRNLAPVFDDEKLRGLETAETAWRLTEAELPDPSTATRPFNQEDMDIIKGGGIVQVWSGLLSEWLLWVRGDQERQALKSQGVKLTIYTLGELVLCAKMTTKEVETMNKLKREFSSTIKEWTP